MNIKQAALALALVVGLASPAGAQSPALDFDDQTPSRAAAGLDFALGASSMGGGAFLLMAGSDRAAGAGVPLLALGVSDLALGVRGLRHPEPDSVLQRRDRYARVGLLLAGAGTASFGAYFESEPSIGAGLGVLGHTAARLLTDLLARPDGPFRRHALDVGLSVTPLGDATVALGSVSGVL